MSFDITHCEGKGCIVKNSCKRNEYFRKNKIKKYGKNFSSFRTPPYIVDNGMFTCDMFWGEPQDMLLEQLKSIIWNSPKKKRKK